MKKVHSFYGLKIHYITGCFLICFILSLGLFTYKGRYLYVLIFSRSLKSCILSYTKYTR